MKKSIVRLAMWSGPRNISTAMMRAWESRPDTMVVDEPLYAPYLLATGLPHPGRDEILAHHETDWRRVVATLTGPVPAGIDVYYQKHMAHHLLPDMDLGWVETLTNAFLIRDPAAMVASLSKVIPDPDLDATGLPQQVALFERLVDAGHPPPPVLDAAEVLADPGAMLRRLCHRIGVPYLDGMLAWAPGPRSTDGVWAPHWYDAVLASTGFEPKAERTVSVPATLASLVEACRPLYETLYRWRLA